MSSFITASIATSCGFPSRNNMVTFITYTEPEVRDSIEDLRASIEAECRKMWTRGFKKILKDYDYELEDVIRDTSSRIKLSNKIRKTTTENYLTTRTDTLRKIDKWQKSLKTKRSINDIPSTLTPVTPNPSVSSKTSEPARVELPSDTTTSLDILASAASETPSAPDSPDITLVQDKPSKCLKCREKESEILNLKLRIADLELKCKSEIQEKNNAFFMYSKAVEKIGSLTTQLTYIRRAFG